MAFDFYEWCQRFQLDWITKRRGEEIGRDHEGNVYYVDKAGKGTRQEKRWVVFNGGESEASRVPPEWHAWLHRQVDAPPAGENALRRPWQKPHQPNPTGTDGAYRPPGHVLEGGQRATATGDYEPWTPA